MTPASGSPRGAAVDPEADAPVRAVGLPAAVAALCLGLVAVVVAGLLTGLSTPGEIADPGALTRWGLPIARFVHHLAMATAVSAVLLAAAAIPARVGPRGRRRRGQDGAEHPVFSAVLRIAGTASVVWTVAAIAVLVLTFSDISGQPISGESSFNEGFLGYIESIATGQAWATVTAIAALFTMLVFAVRSTPGLFVLSGLGLAGIVPIALVGHSSSGDDHIAAVNSLGLHLLGVVVWVGGLAVLLLLAPVLRDQTRRLAARDQGGPELVGTLLRRYSTIAGLAIVLVAASGVVNAELRIFAWDQLITTPYGLMISLKAAAVLALAGIGWMHRSWIIPRLVGAHAGPAARRRAEPSDDDGAAADQRGVTGLLWQLVAVEVAIMSAVVGVSTVLGRTAPPVSEDLPPGASPARIITGYDLPPAPELANYFTLWRLDWLWVFLTVGLAVWYWASVVRLRRRGDSWPIVRGISFVLGLLTLVWVTSGGASIYGLVLFSGHMIQHMTLTMVVPIFLVMGSPVTLALRVLPVRADGTRGTREWILWLVHSRFSRIVTHPVVAAANFAGSLVIFYYTAVFGLALEYHLGHLIMTVHFLLTGYIFALVMVGQDPLPKRPPHPLRLLMLLATMAFHAFLAVSLSGSESLLQAGWFGNMGYDWGFSALEDQQRGGELMWGIGEIPTMLLAVIAAIQWSRDDDRQMRREDREAERTDDAALREYNEMFVRMAENDPHRPKGPRG